MKHALITGASEGIGRAFAQKLATQGYAVTAIARNEKRLQELMQELGGGHSYLPADLSKTEDTARIVKTLTTKKFDLLVNNAGIGVYGTFNEAEALQIDAMMEINCHSLMSLSQAFLQTATNGDALINVSSTASFLPMPVTSVYGASKAFVTALTENLWYEERSKGVYVMALCPGMTESKFHQRAGGHEGQIPKWFSQTPEQVVDIALRALKKRSQPVVVCGPQKPLIFLSKFLPRKWVIWTAGKVLDWGLARSR